MSSTTTDRINWDDPTIRGFLTGSVARRLPGAPRRCFYILGSAVPVLVSEDQNGYREMRGETPAADWVWGATPEDAWRICDLVNAEQIVASSMNRTSAQERILAEVRGAGPRGRVYTGRSRRALDALERDGLIETTSTYSGTGDRIVATLAERC